MIYSGQLKALNTPHELLNEGTADCLAFKSAGLSREYLYSLPGVERVENNMEEFKIYCEDQQTTAYHIFTHCQEKGITLSEFKFEKGSLDDLFVQYLEKEKIG